jgi:hypothetical protein
MVLGSPKRKTSIASAIAASIFSAFSVCTRGYPFAAPSAESMCRRRTLPNKSNRGCKPRRRESEHINLASPHHSSRCKFCSLSLLLAAVENVDQPIDVARPDLVHSSLAVTRAKNAQTQLDLLSSSAAQHTSRVSMVVVIGGAPVLITEVIVKEGMIRCRPAS